MYKSNNIIHNKNGDKMQKITCDVYDCQHCNGNNKRCSLNEIKVSNSSDEEKKEATMCDSYKRRK